LVPIPEESFDILHWTMQAETACQGMIITVYHEMLLNDCHGNTINTQPEPLFFGEMVNRFAPFTYNSGKGENDFSGKGRYFRRGLATGHGSVGTDSLCGRNDRPCMCQLSNNTGLEYGQHTSCTR